MSGKIYPGNDFVETVGPIRGVDPVDGQIKLFAGAVIAFLTTDDESDTPIGTLTMNCPSYGDGRFGVFFDGADLATELASLPDKTVLYRVIKAAGDFRVVDALVLEKIRPSD